MKFSKTTVTNNVEILVGLTDMHTLTPIKIATPASGTVVKLGTPIDASGAIANDETAIGILLYDVDTSANPNGTIIQSGPIDAAKAQAYSGVTYDSDMISALDNIQFRTNIGVNS